VIRSPAISFTSVLLFALTHGSQPLDYGGRARQRDQIVGDSNRKQVE
jgi:hypothetical protein